MVITLPYHHPWLDKKVAIFRGVRVVGYLFGYARLAKLPVDALGVYKGLVSNKQSLPCWRQIQVLLANFRSSVFNLVPESRQEN
jgi:hypothetical protein